MDGSSLRVLSWKKCEGRRHETELNSAPMSCSNMDVDFERSDFFEDLLSDDGSFGAKMGLSYSPDSGHGSPQSFTSSGSSSALSAANDFTLDSNEDFWNSLLDDFGPPSTSQGIKEIENGESTALNWKGDDDLVDTDSLLQSLSGDENDVVDNITVDIDWEMNDERGLVHNKKEVKQEPVSPKPLEQPVSVSIDESKAETKAKLKTSSILINSFNGNNQVVVSTGNKMVPIRGILLKPVHSAGTTTLISVPVSLTSNGTNVQSVLSTNTKVVEKEKAVLEDFLIKQAESKGVSKGHGPNLMLTDEEKKLLETEGVSIPTDTHLTKAEEKVLKKVRRKIKNKQSAMESRKRRKEYTENLEKRVKHCSDVNMSLKKQVSSLTEENKSLLDQLKKLQNMVAKQTKTAQTGTCLAVLLLSFALFTLPFNQMNIGKSGEKSPLSASVDPYASNVVRSRTLLQFGDETVENENHEESNASNILLSKISNLMIHSENYSDNDSKRTVVDSLHVKNLKNNLQNDLVDSENYQSVIEINKEGFSSRWRTSYSDEI